MSFPQSAIIAGITIKPALILAPMAGITNRAFRILCRRHGAGMVVSEFVSSNALVYNSARTHAMVRIFPQEHPVTVQIFGQYPEHLAKAAELITPYGPDVIDINMGCGVPKVTKQGAGAAMMRDITLVRQVFRAVKSATHLPVSVKMRAYWNQNGPSALDICRVAEEEGLSAVTIHPRPGKVHHNFGRADWNIIKQIKDNIGIPVIGNGDVKCGSDALRMADETGCDAVMVGRAAQGNPWIFDEINHFVNTGELLPVPSIADRVNMAIEHGELLIADKNEKIGVQEMRKHISWYMKGFYGAAHFREEVMTKTKWIDMVELLRRVEKDESLGHAMKTVEYFSADSRA